MSRDVLGNIVLLVFVSALSASCSGRSPVAPESAAAVAGDTGTTSSGATQARADHSTVVVRWVPPLGGAVIPGSSSMLVRNDSGLTMTFHTSGLDAGAVYTVWWVVFNHPEFCSPPGCGAKDLGNAAVQASRAHAAGHVIGASGIGNFGAWLDVNDPEGFLDGPWGLTNPRGAEIHLVVRTHGQALTGQLLKAQMGTFNGGCDPGDPYPATTCANKQVAQHLP